MKASQGNSERQEGRNVKVKNLKLEGKKQQGPSSTIRSTKFCHHNLPKEAPLETR